jgi:hypothetical protein
MAVTEHELNEALNRAAALMSPEGQRQIEFAKRQNHASFDGDGNYTRTSGAQYTGQKNIIPQKQMQENINLNRHSGLPKAIIESIAQNPLNDSMSEFSVEGSVLDNIDYTPRKQYREPIQESYVNETYTSSQPTYGPTIQQYPQQPMLTIDYNYIRSIVNECIQTNLKQIKEEILKESTLKVVRLGGENKIQLIDNKNNLYESKLEFKKNLTKK